jgi:hypothetical protein
VRSLLCHGEAGSRTRGSDPSSSLAQSVARWQSDGTVAAEADPEAVAQLLQSICLGFVVQCSLGCAVDTGSHAAGLAALSVGSK